MTGPRSLIRALFALLALILAATPAAARPLTGDERTGLTQTVDSFIAANKTGAADRIIATLPPRMIQAMAQASNVTSEAFRAALVQQTTQTMAGVKVQTFTMDLTKARFLELPNGTPYVLIPTDIAMSAGGPTVSEKSDTLALIDEGKWYLLSVKQPNQVQIFTQLYPDFAGANLGKAEMKVTP